MRKIKYLFILVFLTAALAACASTPDFKPYNGNSLRIAVVGEPPEVIEEQVRFTKISFDEMTIGKLKSYDAVFIEKNNLYKAAESKYTDVYLKSAIPFFFIGTDNYVPFIKKDLAYDKSFNWRPGIGYAVGILALKGKDTVKIWGYGLYNEKKTDENIGDVYSRIFEQIDKLSH
ncbi:hypothetical protein [Bacillus sp. MUM 13]|uniref:hypothetical protein n=1 Tax=Bacillus sp. MUM 13 TaxID=1678001 RepID=UPI0008F59510|nr:hypothetical protein [Bacillus sp. MUM 13]OIK13618.1 hypothetical protein BIV59_05235 [Bacillus sp. MUM 13]